MRAFEILQDARFRGTVSPQKIRQFLGAAGISEARQYYFSMWPDVSGGGVDGAYSGLYSKFDVIEPLEGALIEAVAPPSVEVDIHIVSSSEH